MPGMPLLTEIQANGHDCLTDVELLRWAWPGHDCLVLLLVILLLQIAARSLERALPADRAVIEHHLPTFCARRGLALHLVCGPPLDAIAAARSHAVVVAILCASELRSLRAAPAARELQLAFPADGAVVDHNLPAGFARGRICLHIVAAPEFDAIAATRIHT